MTVIARIVRPRAMMQQKAEATRFIVKEIKRWADMIEKAGLEKQ